MKSFHRRASRPVPAPVVTPAPAPRLRAGLRADALLVEQGLAGSRTAARKLIESGHVLYDGEPLLKPAQELAPGTHLVVLVDDGQRYVSRGGIKLAGALAQTGVIVEGADCLDLGQSTGGFSDCLLQAGAARVVGVDVGHGQLDPRLFADPRLVCREGINARALTPADLGDDFPPGGFDLVVGDLSFISLKLVLPQLPPLAKAGAHFLLLVKPQFEVGPAGLGKNGIVRDSGLYPVVEAEIRAACAVAGLTVRGWFDSPIVGGGVGNCEGNREFFIWTTQ